MPNANKRSVTLDLKNERAREILMRLLGTTDVLVENYLEGALEKLGLGYEQIAAQFPRLVYASGPGLRLRFRLVPDGRHRLHGPGSLRNGERDGVSRSTGSENSRDVHLRGIPCAPVRSVEEVAFDPDVAKRRMLVDIDAPGSGPIKVLGTPVRLPTIDQDVPPRPTTSEAT
jgi:crotonobetainyl-CoA:carnitine CoA-transferase CaiB-like acyl-CoA transferase